MATTVKALKTIIKNKLEALTISGKTVFGVVYDYNEGDFRDYPAAVIRANGGDGIEIDTCRDRKSVV